MPLVMSEVEHLAMFTLPPRLSSLEKWLLKSFAHFLTKLFLHCYTIGILYIFWIRAPHQTYGLQILSPIPWVAFSLCQQGPLMRKHFRFRLSNFLVVSFVSSGFVVTSCLSFTEADPQLGILRGACELILGLVLRISLTTRNGPYCPISALPASQR